MSASRDSTQKVTFLYTNLHEVYKKAKNADLSAIEAAAPVAKAELAHAGLELGRVIKTDDLHAPAFSQVRRHATPELKPELRKVERPAYLATSRENSTLSGLKDNLKQLNDLHSRLRFMLQEIEDLVKE